ncbi:hypothetical protein ACE6H2_020261 [Prunus campanulata]
MDFPKIFALVISGSILKRERMQLFYTLQACRKQKYTNNSQDESAKEHKKGGRHPGRHGRSLRVSHSLDVIQF